MKKLALIQTLLLLGLSLTSSQIIAQTKAVQQAVTESSDEKASQEISTLSADDWQDEWADDWQETTQLSPWKFSYFVEVAYGKFMQNNIVESNASLSELRGRINLDYSHAFFELTAKGDFLYDDVLEQTDFNTRELNIAFSPLKNLDVKLGRQVLTWGTGDYLFLNDLFKKDWQSFFSGRDDEYLKSASDSIRMTSYWGDFTVDLAWTPEFTPDNYLTGERFSFYSSLMKTNIAPDENFRVEQTQDSQWSARVATSIQGVEYALYGYKGFWTTPLGMNQQGMAYFPKMNAWGASALTPLSTGIFKMEFSAYNSLEDRQGNQAAIPNSQIRALIGYEQEVIKNLSVGLQYYLEKTQHYNAYTQSALFTDEVVDEYRQLATVRLRYTTMQQKLIYSLFAFYSPTDQDSYLKPAIHYRYNDNYSFSAGANIFSGNQDFTFFGQHQANTNVWLRGRFSF
ncbi:hypothetical protein [Thalassotalea sp. SU-HH00458]|uniref:hypothetical protein n=1 Tax=Thalassotalea sp. SU-HH00458 TaxID=3127657 RepID=UPI003102FFAE